MIGFVQAGGGSTRFGTDKALVRIGGETMLARTVGVVAKACEVVQIVAPEGKYEGAPAPVLADRYPGEGPLGGILTVLAAVQSTQEWALVVSCDMPFLQAEFLSFLCGRARTSGAEVVVPESGNGLEPLCAVWNAAALPTMQAAFDSGVRKVTEAMKRLSMEVLDESVWKRFDTHKRLFWNMNAPEDFEEVRRVLEGSKIK